MKKLLAALLATAALVVAAGANADPLRYGIADDWPKYHACGDVWWQSASDIGYHDLRMTVQWDGTPAIPSAGEIAAAVDCALLHDTRPILAIYPARPRLIGSRIQKQNAFAAFVASVGLAFPKVTTFVVGNEPNVNRFWQPQFVAGRDAAGRDYEHTLARSYDALKSVRPDAIVWGPAISSRGNDHAHARSNPSHSPVWFIKDMGDAYRASGRTKPIFDEFDMHPYPPSQDKSPYTQPFQWPQAGAANLDRIKQAIWDAFHRTGQPVVAEQPASELGPSLPLNLDEVGSQTVVAGHGDAYADRPESISAISERLQARYYTQLMEMAACDPAVRSLLFFDLIDEPDVHDGFQSGNLFADLSHKLSYDAVKRKIASAAGRCQGGVAGVPQAWTHTDGVVGARAHFPTGRAPIGITAAEDARYRTGLIRVRGVAGAAPAAAARMLSSAKAVTLVGASEGLVRAYARPLVRLRPRLLAEGYYVYAVTFTSVVDPSRSTTLVSRAFRAGPAAGPKPKSRRPSA